MLETTNLTLTMRPTIEHPKRYYKFANARPV